MTNITSAIAVLAPDTQASFSCAMTSLAHEGRSALFFAVAMIALAIIGLGGRRPHY